MKRTWGAILALLAAGLLVTAVVTKSWWKVSEHDRSMGVGPLGAEMCADGKCVGGPLPTEHGFRTLGTSTLAASLAAAGFALLAAFVALAKKKTRVLGVLGLICSVAALGVAITFVVSAPGKGANDNLAWGMYVGMSGGLLGVIGCSLIITGVKAAGLQFGVPMTAAPGAKTLMLADTASTAGPNAATIAPGMASAAATPAPPPKASGKPGAMVPPCPRCHGPLQYAAQFKSWFCPRCQSYVQT
jgi:hypothetical protein